MEVKSAAGLDWSIWVVSFAVIGLSKSLYITRLTARDLQAFLVLSQRVVYCAGKPVERKEYCWNSFTTESYHFSEWEQHPRKNHFVREEAKFAGKENNQMRRGQSVERTGAWKTIIAPYHLKVNNLSMCNM